MHRRVERRARLIAVDTLDDHRIVAHRAADETTLAGKRRRRAFAYDPQILLAVALAPGVVVMIVHAIGLGAADDPAHPLAHPFAARTGVASREFHRRDVAPSALAV